MSQSTFLSLRTFLSQSVEIDISVAIDILGKSDQNRIPAAVQYVLRNLQTQHDLREKVYTSSYRIYYVDVAPPEHSSISNREIMMRTNAY